MSWPHRNEQPRRSPHWGNGGNSQSAFYCQSADSSTQGDTTFSARELGPWAHLQTWLVPARRTLSQPGTPPPPGVSRNPPTGAGQAGQSGAALLRGAQSALDLEVSGLFLAELEITQGGGVGDGGQPELGQQGRGGQTGKGRKNRKWWSPQISAGTDSRSDGSTCAPWAAGSRPQRLPFPAAVPAQHSPDKDHALSAPITGAPSEVPGESRTLQPTREHLALPEATLAPAPGDHTPRGRVMHIPNASRLCFCSSHLRPRVQKAGEALPKQPPRPCFPACRIQTHKEKL